MAMTRGGLERAEEQGGAAPVTRRPYLALGHGLVALQAALGMALVADTLVVAVARLAAAGRIAERAQLRRSGPPGKALCSHASLGFN